MRRLIAIVIAIVIVVLVRYYGQKEQSPEPPPKVTTETAAKQVIRPKGFRPTPSPLSPAILVGETLYVSGNTGGDPQTGKLVEGGLEAEMHQIFSNLKTVLGAANMSLDDVVSVTSYLASMDDFPRYNEIYREYFNTQPLPTRATVAVKELARNAQIEISAIAVKSP
jgi:2-iminobutanoate/2-iminopropanoate deaminase